MKSHLGGLLAFMFVGLAALPLYADPVNLILIGNGGLGLRGDNINPRPTDAGSGGIAAGGLTFDAATGFLDINIEWGSGNGYTDLSGPVTKLHLHGFTASSAPDSYSETTPDIIYNFTPSPKFNSSGSDGGLYDERLLFDPPDFDALLNGRAYFNVHTALNPNGEIRGYLLAIPEPASGFFYLLGLVLINRRSRR